MSTTTGLQYLLIFCKPGGVREMAALVDELTDMLRTSLPAGTAPNVLTIGYGVTIVSRQGYILLLVRGEIPASFAQYVREDTTIVDCISIVIGGRKLSQEDEACPKDPEPLHLTKLPKIPAGFFLLAEPASLHRLLGDERWIGYVDDEDEGAGVLLYEEDTSLLFLNVEEATSAAAYLVSVAPALLAACSPEYARLHTSEVESLQLAIWDAQQRARRAQLPQEEGEPHP